MEPGKKRSYGGSCAERECTQIVVREWQQQQEARSVVVQELAGRGVQYIGALPSQLACGGGGQGFGGTGVCHQRRRVLPTAHPCPLSLPPHFLCCHHSLSLHLKKVKLTHSLYPRPSRLSSALPSAPISSSAPNPPLTPLIALQQTAHSPHHRLISCCILMPQNLPSTSHLPVSCAKPSMLPASHEPCVEVLA